MADWKTDDWGYVNGVNEDTLKEINGIFGRGSDFVGRISEIRRTSPRKNRTRARVTWISRSESSARCRIYARKNRIWGAVFRGLCSQQGLEEGCPYRLAQQPELRDATAR